MQDSEDSLIVLGRHIRKLRRDRDLSQEALGGEAGVTANHLRAIERGKKSAGVSVLFRIADALKIKPAELFSPFDDPS